MIECEVEGCEKESRCNHCFKCQEHHDIQVEGEVI